MAKKDLKKRKAADAAALATGHGSWPHARRHRESADGSYQRAFLNESGRPDDPLRNGMPRACTSWDPAESLWSVVPSLSATDPSRAHRYSHRYHSHRVAFTLIDKPCQPAVERGEDSAALNCGGQQHGVRDLSIALKAADDLLGQVGDGAIKGPERVRLQLPESL